MSHISDYELEQMRHRLLTGEKHELPGEQQASYGIPPRLGIIPVPDYSKIISGTTGYNHTPGVPTMVKESQPGAAESTATTQKMTIDELDEWWRMRKREKAQAAERIYSALPQVRLNKQFWATARQDIPEQLKFLQLTAKDIRLLPFDQMIDLWNVGETMDYAGMVLDDKLVILPTSSLSRDSTIRHEGIHLAVGKIPYYHERAQLYKTASKGANNIASRIHSYAISQQAVDADAKAVIDFITTYQKNTSDDLLPFSIAAEKYAGALDRIGKKVGINIPSAFPGLGLFYFFDGYLAPMTETWRDPISNNFRDEIMAYYGVYDDKFAKAVFSTANKYLIKAKSEEYKTLKKQAKKRVQRHVRYHTEFGR